MRNVRVATAILHLRAAIRLIEAEYGADAGFNYTSVIAALIGYLQPRGTVKTAAVRR